MTESSQVVMSYRSHKTVVRKSAIHGMGLFADLPIFKDEIIAVKGGHIFSREMLNHVEKELGPAEIQIDDDLFIGPLNREEREGAMLFLNHSCNPNVGIQGQIVFVAMRDISRGEELTHDWATTDDDDYEMQCNCGAANCRRIVTGKDWRRKDLQQKYRSYFAWHLQKKIDENK